MENYISKEAYDNKIVIMYDNEIVNGYKLYNHDCNILSYKYFLEKVPELFFGEDVMTFDIFNKKLDDRLNCGLSLIYEENSKKYNVGILKTKRKIQKLWNLPYNKKLVYKIVRGMYSNREQVRYTNFMCEWIKRKYYLIKYSKFFDKLCNLRNKLCDIHFKFS